MTKYVLVNKEPSKLDKDCIVIGEPDFISEIEKCFRKKPRSMSMSINYLREIVSTIGLKYASEDFNPLSSVNVSLYRGVPCTTDKETQAIVVQAFKKSYPEIFTQYVDYQIKNRPKGTKLIYFSGDPNFASAFLSHGIDFLPTKEIDLFLKDKPKKVVGKPAITKEKADKLNNVV